MHNKIITEENQHIYLAFSYHSTYLLISPVLSGALAYAIADRRPLRDAHPFFRKLSLLRETLVCVAIIVLSLLAIAIVWLIGTSL